MNINIRGKKIEVTEAIRNYIEEKIGKIDKYLKNDNYDAHILIKLRGYNQIVEATINTNHFVLRAEEAADDLYAAIDKVSDKLERQIRKNKTRMHKKINKEKIQEFELSDLKDNEDTKTIVKRKTIDTKPMDEEEAILQMELIGHDFFAFKNADTNSLSVVYKRKDNDYGLLEIK